MKSIASPIVLMLALAACSGSPEADPQSPKSDPAQARAQPVPAEQTAPDDEPFFCGGETTQAKAEEFFADLRQALSSEDGPSKFNRFVAPRFWVTRGEQSIYYDLADFNSVTPRFITIEDWEAIDERGLEVMGVGGWRGCSMDHGKVWLDAYGEDGILLKGINHDLEWVEPSSKN